MTESITSRVARIVSGSVNLLIDAVENAAPETVMEQAIREIDGAIGDVRAELGRQAAGKHLANSRLTDANAKNKDLGEKIAVALGDGRDDLAEVAIGQQIDIEAQIPVLEQAIAEASGRERELEGYILALQAKKREMDAELQRFRQSRAAPPPADGESGDGGGAPTGGVEEAVRRAD